MVNEGGLIMTSTHNLCAPLISYEPAHNWLITSTYACIESCVDRPYFTSGARIRSCLCSTSVKMLTEHKAGVASIKWHEPAQKIRAAREYMRDAHNVCARLIKACRAFPLSVCSVYSVVNYYPCSSVSIRGSKGPV